MPSEEAPKTGPDPKGGDLVPIRDLHAQIVTPTGGTLQEDFQLLVGNLIDDSCSIENYENTDAVIRGHNANLEMFRQRALGAPDRILVMTRFLTAGRLHDYCTPARAALLNRENYRPIHGTPLYHQSTTFLGDEVLSSVREMQRGGRKILTFNTIFSDGEDTERGHYTVDDARRVVERMLEMRTHIIAAIGVEGAVDPYQIFRAMGIPEQWIKVIARRNADIAGSFTDAGAHAWTSSRSVADFDEVSETGFGPKRPKKP